MPEIRGFSERFYEAGRQYYREHPVFKLTEHREVDMSSPMVEVVEMRCERCGFSYAPKQAVVHADTLRATTWTHAYDRDTRSRYCGGRALLRTA